jgi:hypothetical protein
MTVVAVEVCIFLSPKKLSRTPQHTQLYANDFIFKLEEEGNVTLLLHLPKLFAETAVFSSAVGLGCRLVVETPQAEQTKKAASFGFSYCP